jgi:hypothetical protein
VNGSSCAGGACEWWGCWQWDAEPPGRFVSNFVHDNAAAGAIPMITVYIWYAVAGYVEGGAEVGALTDGARLRSFLLDFRFLCRMMAEDPPVTSLLHIEPDLWGYGHQVNSDPSTIPVALSAAGMAECSGLSDDFGGFARCLLAIVRGNAPNTLVGFHASAWGAGADALMNTDAGFDVNDHADRTASFMRALGADAADFIVVEQSDRDAAFRDRWWDDTNATLPSFTQALAWTQRLGQQLNLPLLWWQVPYGDMAGDNSCYHYQDNRVDYFFAHPQDYAAGGALGIAFGAGADCQTTPQYDGGHFAAHANAYFTSDRPRLCGL